MSEPTNNMSIMTNIFAEPQIAFKNIRQEYPVIFPLSFFLVLLVVVTLTYTANVDYEWSIEQNVEMLAGDKTKAEQDAVRAQMTLMEPMTQAIVGSIVTVVGYLILFCLYAAYYLVNSNINNDGYDFKQWLSFISWTWLPKCVVLLISLVIVLISDDGQITQNSLNPISLNSLFFDLSPFSGLGSMLTTIDLSTFWTVGLMIIGYKSWTESSLSKSIMIVLTPYIIVFGIWTYIAI
jgi:hypothetical protein